MKLFDHFSDKFQVCFQNLTKISTDQLLTQLLCSSVTTMIQYMLLFSRQGKLRLQKWYNPIGMKEKRRTTRELITMILSRKPKMCSFLEYRDQKIVYKRYASLFFCVAIDNNDNELLTLEIVHRYVCYLLVFLFHSGN